MYAKTCGCDIGHAVDGGHRVCCSAGFTQRANRAALPRHAADVRRDLIPVLGGLQSGETPLVTKFEKRFESIQTGPKKADK